MGLKGHTCRSKIPKVAAPNLVPISPRSLSSCSTKAELERLRAAPITTASSTDLMLASCAGVWKMLVRIRVPTPCPTGNAKAVKTNVDSAMLIVPKPKAYFANACTSGLAAITATD